MLGTFTDTIRLVAQTIDRHRLPATGAHISARGAQVFCSPGDLTTWVRWLAEGDDARFVVWHSPDDQAALHLSGIREDCEWSMTGNVPAELAGMVLAKHGLSLNENHQQITAVVAAALLGTIRTAGLARAAVPA